MAEPYEFVVCGTDPLGREHVLIFRSSVPFFRPPPWLNVRSACMRSPTSRCDRSSSLPASTSPNRPCCG